MSYTNIKSNLSPSQRRHALQREIYKWASVTIPIEQELLDDLFADVSIKTWARCVGVAYTVDKFPDPEWRCKKTLIFHDIRGANEYLIDCDAIDL